MIFNRAAFRSWLKKGERVQSYTRRGAERSGNKRFRWRANAVFLQEILAGIVVSVLFVLLLLLPSIAWQAGYEYEDPRGKVAQSNE